MTLTSTSLSKDDSEKNYPIWITGAEALMDSLKVHDVKVIFGYPGGAILPIYDCLLYTSPSPRDLSTSRMPSSA